MKVLVGTDDAQTNWTLEKPKDPSGLKYAIEITPQLYFRYVNSKASFDEVQRDINLVHEEHWKKIREQEDMAWLPEWAPAEIKVKVEEEPQPPKSKMEFELVTKYAKDPEAIYNGSDLGLD